MFGEPKMSQSKIAKPSTRGTQPILHASHMIEAERLNAAQLDHIITFLRSHPHQEIILTRSNQLFAVFLSPAKFAEIVRDMTAQGRAFDHHQVLGYSLEICGVI
jgi:hypothetical protein